MKIKPLADRVVVEQLELKETTASGIILPESAKEKPSEGRVIAIGSDVKEVGVGDKVLYSKYGPTEIKVDNKEYMIIKEEDILATLEGDK